MPKFICALLSLFFCALLLAGCDKEQPEAPRERKRLTVYSTLSSPLVEALVNEFEKQRDVRVDLIAGDVMTYPEDAGEADVILGLPPEIAAEHRANLRIYASLNEYNLQRELQTAEDCVTCFAVCTNVLLVNTNLAGSTEIHGYADLLLPELKGQVSMSNPKFSAVGYGHLINILQAEENGKLPPDYLPRLLANGLQLPVETAAVAAANVAKGKVTAALTTESAAREQIQAGAPVSIVYMQEGTLSYPLGISIAEWTPARHEAEDFVDFLTSRSTQEVLLRQLYLRPARSDLPVRLSPGTPQASPAGGVFNNQALRRERNIEGFLSLLPKSGVKP